MPHLIANDILIPEMAALLREGHQVRFTPSGVSMRPFIEGGKDSVVLERKPRYRVGDIVLMQLPTTYVLHRLIAVDGDRVTLRGDGNLYGVEQGTQADILGYVTEIRSPKGCRKIISKGRVWHALFPVRGFLLKVYRHLFIYPFAKHPSRSNSSRSNPSRSNFSRSKQRKN